MFGFAVVAIDELLAKSYALHQVFKTNQRLTPNEADVQLSMVTEISLGWEQEGLAWKRGLTRDERDRTLARPTYTLNDMSLYSSFIPR